MTGSLAATAEGITDLLRDFFAAERVAAADGFLQAREPRAALLGITGLVVAAMLTRSPFVLAGLAGLVLALALASDVPLGRLLGRSAVVPLATALIVAPQLFIQPGDPFVGVAGLVVTTGGVAYVVVFTARVAVAVLLLSLLVLTTPFAAIVGAARRLGVPVPFVQVLALTYRYLFLFFDELNRLLLARNSRRVGGDSLAEEWEDARRLTGIFLLRALERGERVGRGMRARGGSRPPSPYTRDTTLDRGDYAFAALTAAAIAVSVVVRWGF